MENDKPKILIAEDKPPLQALLVAMLTKQGYPVITANDGLEACKLYDQSKINGSHIGLLITDFEMPNLNGLELAYHITKDNSDFPIIMLSGKFNPELIKTAMEHGVKYCIAKPCSLDELSDAVEQALKK